MTILRGMTCVVLGLSFIVAGCIPTDAEIESDLSAERRAAYLDWKRMRDRGESTNIKVTGPLALDDAIKMALQYNKALQAILQERDVTRGQRISAWSVALPSVMLTGDAIRNENRGGNNLASYSTGVTVTQPIMQGEVIPATIRQSRLMTALTDETIRQSVQDLIASVANSYYDVLLAQLLLETNKEAVISAEAQLRVVTEKRKQETATDYDVLRAQVDVATYRAQMLSQQNSIDTNRVALLKYMGVSQDSEITFSNKLEFLPMRPVFERAVEIASGLRPDLRQAEITARVNDEAVKIARSAYWPMLSGSFTESWSDDSNTPFLRRDNFARNDWQAGVGASWYFGIDNYGNVEQAKARARQGRIDILDREENMLSEIRTYMNTLSNAEEVVKALVVNQSASREALRLVEIGYQAGVKTELDVQDARKALTDVQGQYATALADHTKARLNLQIAMGVLGPQRVGEGQIQSPSVPIANIQEFAATDYKPLTPEELTEPVPDPSVDEMGIPPASAIPDPAVDRMVVPQIAPKPTPPAKPATPATPPAPATPANPKPPAQPKTQSRAPAPVPNAEDWRVMEDFLGASSAGPAAAGAAASRPTDSVMLAANPAVAAAPADKAPAMPPGAVLDSRRGAPVPPPSQSPAATAEQAKPAPLFKVTVKEGAQAGS